MMLSLAADSVGLWLLTLWGDPTGAYGDLRVGLPHWLAVDDATLVMMMSSAAGVINPLLDPLC